MNVAPLHECSLTQAPAAVADGKELTALDQPQVRSWTSWMRWAILAMLAHVFLSVVTAAQPRPGHGGDVHRDEARHELIP
jgi:hypothetical protein